MGAIVFFYKLFQFKDDLAAILKRYCCHSNVTYKFILTTVRLLTCSSVLDTTIPLMLLRSSMKFERFLRSYVYYVIPF